jgi:hypothetical protein
MRSMRSMRKFLEVIEAIFLEIYVPKKKILVAFLNLFANPSNTDGETAFVAIAGFLLAVFYGTVFEICERGPRSIFTSII